jgi:hypothetical protein
MISAVLFFLGTTLTYTGYLAMDRNLTVGLAVALAGLILIIKPVLEAQRYFAIHFGSPRRPRGGKPEPKGKPRKLRLKVVKSDRDRPTIH